MAQGRTYKTFVLSGDLLHRLDSLKKQLTIEQKGLLFQGILEFENGVEPDFGGNIQVETAFEYLVRFDLEENNKKYDDVVERNRANGAKGGRPRKNDNPNNPENPQNPNIPNKPNNPQGPENPENLDIDSGFVSDNHKNITADAAADLCNIFDCKKAISATLGWQLEAARLARQFKLDLGAEFVKKKGGKAYQIADSWFKLFRDGGGPVVGRLEAAYSYFADQERFLALPDDVKWGYLRDIAHNGLEQFKQKGHYNG